MLKLTIPVGHVVEIGDVAAIKVFARKGQSVCLGFETALVVTRNATGIIPPRFRPTGIKPSTPLALAAAS